MFVNDLKGESDIIVLLEIDLPAELKKESGSEEDNTEVVGEGESGQFQVLAANKKAVHITKINVRYIKYMQTTFNVYFSPSDALNDSINSLNEDLDSISSWSQQFGLNLKHVNQRQFCSKEPMEFYECTKGRNRGYQCCGTSERYSFLHQTMPVMCDEERGAFSASTLRMKGQLEMGAKLLTIGNFGEKLGDGRFRTTTGRQISGRGLKESLSYRCYFEAIVNFPGHGQDREIQDNKSHISIDSGTGFEDKFLNRYSGLVAPDLNPLENMWPQLQKSISGDLDWDLTRVKMIVGTSGMIMIVKKTRRTSKKAVALRPLHKFLRDSDEDQTQFMTVEGREANPTVGIFIPPAVPCK
ncbi:hypothetical protein ANN_19220 [Periplaneta americana]|uniref:Uncharacterized protein n=1 Tax=Periplaneta americana TaxID=6978 RepID=A0ABQ8S9A2_PERAM|nr:hypothetical protein ANN_19220 [Periplaneta americana]